MEEKNVKKLFKMLNKEQRRQFILELQIKLELSQTMVYVKLRDDKFKEIEREAALKLIDRLMNENKYKKITSII